jgi:hypothetical protein
MLDREVARLSKRLGVQAEGFSPDHKRIVLARCFKERNIQVLFQTILCQAKKEGDTIGSVLVSAPDGLYEVQALLFIDATGDADLAALTGCALSDGRERDGLPHPLSLVPRMMNARGKISFTNFDGGWVDAADPDDVTRAWMESRRQVSAFYDEGLHVLGIPSQIGIREGPHLLGELVVTPKDYFADRIYPDTIVRTYSHYDNHARDFGNENDFCQTWVVLLGLLKAPLSGDIPYRAMLTENVPNLLVTGRAISLHRDVFAGMRMQRDMQKVGEASGIAAALAIREQKALRDIDIGRLQHILIRRGVLKSGDLERTGTDNGGLLTGPLAKRRLGEGSIEQLLPELLTYLGGEEEGLALLWFARAGEQGAAALIQLLSDESSRYEQRRAAAFGLAVLGKREAIPMLLQVVKQRDAYCPPPELKAIPRWVAAVAALRMLRAIEAVDEVLALLHESHNPGHYTFMLRYFQEAGPLCAPAIQERIVREIHLWLDGELAHQPFMLQGSVVSVNYDWNLRMNAALALFACGSDAAWSCCAPYMDDKRAYVRQFAEKCRSIICKGDTYDGTTKL